MEQEQQNFHIAKDKTFSQFRHSNQMRKIAENDGNSPSTHAS